MEDREYEKLLHTHRRSLLGYAFAMCRNFHIAEDMVQEALTIAWAKRSHYFPEADFGSWLRAIVRNVWLRQVRSESRRPDLSCEFIEQYADEMFAPAQYEESPWQEEKTALAQCIRKLEARDRRLIDMHIHKGYSYSRLSQRLGRTVNWVKVRMFRIRQALGTCVKKTLEISPR